ncbi:anti-sigma factor [Bacillus massiliigorillae]|uniref:anti-sigma factor n=1 Tax=Bacillus massiliigorillae TaxID=1243664 RepID=UPI0003A3B7DF|nr:anti-sigma factor [Bacillus massiliigorillae]
MSQDRKDEEIYNELMKETISIMNEQSLTDAGQAKIVQTGKNMARITTVLLSVAFLLMIFPLLLLSSYVYYAVGGKATTLMDVVSKTIYVTEPNVSVEEMEFEQTIGVFSMKLDFDLFKKIGNEEYNIGDENIQFDFSAPRFPKKHLHLDRPLPEIPVRENEILFHPKVPLQYDPKIEWTKLKGLPDETMSEAYVSLSSVMNKKDLQSALPPKVELRWLAVDTGIEEEQIGEKWNPYTALGYPAQVDTTTWSPFNGREQTNEEVFVDILRFLEGYEDEVTKLARAKVMSIKERRQYVEKKGIKVYGAVVTGPTSEIRKLEAMKEVRAVKLGEVKLWN